MRRRKEGMKTESKESRPEPCGVQLNPCDVLRMTAGGHDTAADQAQHKKKKMNRHHYGC